jgi:p-aminobenzoyl-glutamate transporter AbgT
MSGIVTIIFLFGALGGLAYGMVTRSIRDARRSHGRAWRSRWRRSRDTSCSCLFASQFVAYFSVDVSTGSFSPSRAPPCLEATGLSGSFALIGIHRTDGDRQSRHGKRVGEVGAHGPRGSS